MRHKNKRRRDRKHKHKTPFVTKLKMIFLGNLSRHPIKTLGGIIIALLIIGFLLSTIITAVQEEKCRQQCLCIKQYGKGIAINCDYSCKSDSYSDDVGFTDSKLRSKIDSYRQACNKYKEVQTIMPKRY